MQRENFPWESISVIAKVLEDNSEKYAPGDWRKIHIQTHISHALKHISNFLDRKMDGEDHLAHALCRLAMAIALTERP